MTGPDSTFCAQALWITAPGRCELRPVTVEAQGRPVVRTAFTGISRGTEATVLAGRVPPSEHARMRGPHQEGEFTFPVKYGYAAVGMAETGDLAGRWVFCLHPHQDRFAADPALLTPVPDGVPPARAVLAANMETALNIVWDAALRTGDRINVFGAGVVGALCAHLAARIAGTEVRLVDTDPSRAAVAAALEVPFGPPHPEADVAINASGSDAALATALNTCGPEARVVEASWYGDRSASIPLGGAFHARRLRIVSSQVGQVAAAQRARWPHARRMAKALDLLADDRLDALVSGESAFGALAQDYPGILSSSGTLCHRITY
ncbi:dehydrogenase [Falsirhodobacter algicola]|uniref:Dehydrogenase n=1 Tax=Falsirhodobacter algicola TaxID=2692330 RepID=A0A8J8SLU5_9RHOB|nr:dehydrogenase [Falsirhodobacter algicola]